MSQVTYSKHLAAILNHFWNRWRTKYLAQLRESHKCNKKSMSSKLVISENDVAIVRDSKIFRPYWRLALVESIIISKDKKVSGAKVRLPNSNILERPINMLYPIETTKINNTNKSYSSLEKENEPEIDFVVNTNDFCFNKTVLKNGNVVKPNLVIKPDDDADVKDERNIGESEDRCDEQQVTTRQPRREAAEKADLKIKHCH